MFLGFKNNGGRTPGFYGLPLCALLLLPSVSARDTKTNSAETAAHPIILLLQQAAERQRSQLCGYSVVRRYTLHNKHLAHDAAITALLTYSREHGKTFTITSMEHASGIVKHAMLELVNAEPRTEGEGEQNGTVDETNYRFELLDTEPLNGQPTYHMRLIPRRRGTMLINGEIWIHASEYAVLRIRGQVSQSVSFWVGRPDVEQDFAKIQGFWMPSYNRSVAHVRFAGEADLTVRYSDYKFQTCPSSPKGS